MTSKRTLVGLLPAAGRATRLGPIPCSKEIFPVGFRAPEAGGHPVPVVAHVLEQLRVAGVERAYLVLSPGKWDIPTTLHRCQQFGLDLAYVVVEDSPDAIFSVDAAHAFVSDSTVAFGFPDIISTPRELFGRVLQRLEGRDVDVVLAAMPVEDASKMDVIDLDEKGRLRAIVCKPSLTQLKLTWVGAAWNPRFTSYIRAYLAERRRPEDPGEDRHIGHVLQAAITDGLAIEAEVFTEGRYIDIGTPADLARAVASYTPHGALDAG